MFDRFKKDLRPLSNYVKRMKMKSTGTTGCVSENVLLKKHQCQCSEGPGGVLPEKLG